MSQLQVNDLRFVRDLREIGQQLISLADLITLSPDSPSAYMKADALCKRFGLIYDTLLDYVEERNDDYKGEEDDGTN